MRDEFLRMARPAIMIAGMRTGGTFLCHCLSNHPRIFCDRGEPLDSRNVWARTLTHDLVKILDGLTHQPFYHVSMCKLVYGQAFDDTVWRYIAGCKQQLHIIHLTRRNVLRQAVSASINMTNRDRPAHALAEVPPIAIVPLAPQSVLNMMKSIAKQVRDMRMRLAKFPHVLELEYTDLAGEVGQTGGMSVTYLREETGRSACAFLGVPYVPLFSELRRLNPQPLDQIVSNWLEIRDAIQASPFADCLEEESSVSLERAAV